MFGSPFLVLAIFLSNEAIVMKAYPSTACAIRGGKEALVVATGRSLAL